MTPLPVKFPKSILAMFPFMPSSRFLFAIPHFKGANGKEGMFDAEMEVPGEVVLTLKGQPSKPESAILLGDGTVLDHQFSNGVLTVTLPAARRTKLVDVVRVER